MAFTSSNTFGQIPSEVAAALRQSASIDHDINLFKHTQYVYDSQEEDMRLGRESEASQITRVDVYAKSAVVKMIVDKSTMNIHAIPGFYEIYESEYHFLDKHDLLIKFRHYILPREKDLQQNTEEYILYGKSKKIHSVFTRTYKINHPLSEDSFHLFDDLTGFKEFQYQNKENDHRWSFFSRRAEKALEGAEALLLVIVQKDQ